MNRISLILFLIYHIMCDKLDNSLTFGLYKHNGEYKSNFMRNLEVTTPIYGNTSVLNYYFVNLYIGTPSIKQSLIIDTGSLLTTIPCQPFCESCGRHINSYYNFTGMINLFQIHQQRMK
jgi:hypothetical protein